MISYVPYDEEKAIHAMLYVLNGRGDVDRHRLLKIIYFAEQGFISTQGFPYIGGHFVAMKKGPVHSEIFDIIKRVAEGYTYNDKFNPTSKPHFNIAAAAQYDEGEIAENFKTQLDLALEKYFHLSHEELTKFSHDAAWEEAYGRDRGAAENMDYMNIARVVNSDESMLNYLSSNLHRANA